MTCWVEWSGETDEVGAAKASEIVLRVTAGELAIYGPNGNVHIAVAGDTVRIPTELSWSVS